MESVLRHAFNAVFLCMVVFSFRFTRYCVRAYALQQLEQPAHYCTATDGDTKKSHLPLPFLKFSPPNFRKLMRFLKVN